MNAPALIYVGFKRRVAALERATGNIVWEWKADKGSSYLTLLLDGDILIVSVDGYMYGLDAYHGSVLWFNPMSGYGTGVASIASAAGSSQNQAALARQIAEASRKTSTVSQPS